MTENAANAWNDVIMHLIAVSSMGKVDSKRQELPFKVDVSNDITVALPVAHCAEIDVTLLSSSCLAAENAADTV